MKKTAKRKFLKKWITYTEKCWLFVYLIPVSHEISTGTKLFAVTVTFACAQLGITSPPFADRVYSPGGSLSSNFPCASDLVLNTTAVDHLRIAVTVV
jgi:hypothetical protein